MPKDPAKKKKSKKRKRASEDADKSKAASRASTKAASSSRAEGETKEKGRDFTVSIALPGSFVDNAQSRELRTYLVGQIARAATVFCVDEVVVFDDKSTSVESSGGQRK